MMLSSYFKVALRHLSRSKTFSIINVAGLAIGISAFILIVQYISFETSYDHFHANRSQIYRVALARNNDGVQTATAENFAGLRKLLREEFSGITAATGFYKTPANTGATKARYSMSWVVS
jgi:putative ABC transport system permease protein